MLETYLTMRSGVHVAEAIGALATKLLALVLAGLILYGVGMAVEDGGLGAVVAVVLLPPLRSRLRMDRSVHVHRGGGGPAESAGPLPAPASRFAPHTGRRRI